MLVEKKRAKKSPYFPLKLVTEVAPESEQPEEVLGNSIEDELAKLDALDTNDYEAPEVDYNEWATYVNELSFINPPV